MLNVSPDNLKLQQLMENLPSAFQQEVQSSLGQAGKGTSLAMAILSQLIKRQYVTESGRKVELPPSPTGAPSPADLGDSIIRAADQQLTGQVAAPLMAEFKKQRRDALVELLTREYYDPDDPQRDLKHARERAEANAENPSIEKVLLTGLFWLNGHKEALKTVSSYMDKIGGGSFRVGDQVDRKRNGLMQAAAQLYRNVADMGEDAPLIGENTNTKMQAALSIMDKGGFEDIFSKPGMFKMDGGLTDDGQKEVNRLYRNAGEGITELRKLTGSDAMQSLHLSRQLFGDSALKQLTDAETVKSLGGYRHLAEMANLSPRGRVQLLARLQASEGKKGDILPTLNKAQQRLGLDLMGDWVGQVDPQEKSQLLGRIVEGASKSKWLKAASAGAAALSDEYGKSTGWALMQDILETAPLQAGDVLRKTNELLDGPRKITKNNLHDYLASDEAYDYYRSGRALPRAATREAYRVYNDMSRQSPWVAKHFPRILQSQDGLTRSSIVNYLDEHGANSAQKGQVLRHINSFADRYKDTYGTADMDVMLNFLSAGAKHRERSRLLKEAVRRGQVSRDLAPESGVFGIEGILRSLSNPNPEEGFLGTALAGLPLGNVSAMEGKKGQRIEHQLDPRNSRIPPAPPEGHATSKEQKGGTPPKPPKPRQPPKPKTPPENLSLKSRVDLSPQNYRKHRRGNSPGRPGAI